ncbi:transposase [Amycolatopsis viridis]|uniref:Transposase n=1 Tax=Amycolatopsis viridis TaxID=185678 RepID=A0ABX0SZ88_9PSEU|nr:hypothetical protein [Amycolatopsis viridis]NIH82271.1 transposase [Amycolatopsis viridis]
MSESVICSRCGVPRNADVDPLDALAWVSDRDGGALRWLCPRCAREHVRDIEGKLPSEYW